MSNVPSGYAPTLPPAAGTNAGAGVAAGGGSYVTDPGVPDFVRQFLPGGSAYADTAKQVAPAPDYGPPPGYGSPPKQAYPPPGDVKGAASFQEPSPPPPPGADQSAGYRYLAQCGAQMACCGPRQSGCMPGQVPAPPPPEPEAPPPPPPPTPRQKGDEPPPPPPPTPRQKGDDPTQVDKPAAPKPADDCKDQGTYVVKPGDWLSKIAPKYGITWQQLYWYNRDSIKHPDLIFPGQKLRIPPCDLKVPDFDYTPRNPPRPKSPPKADTPAPPKATPPKDDPKPPKGDPPKGTPSKGDPSPPPPPPPPPGKGDKGGDSPEQGGSTPPPPPAQTDGEQVAPPPPPATDDGLPPELPG